jgi:hypothetical protein
MTRTAQTRLEAWERLLDEVTADPEDLTQMTRERALESFISRARRNLEEIEQLEVDVEYMESRFPGHFTEMLAGITADRVMIKNQLVHFLRQKGEAR